MAHQSGYAVNEYPFSLSPIFGSNSMDTPHFFFDYGNLPRCRLHEFELALSSPVDLFHHLSIITIMLSRLDQIEASRVDTEMTAMFKEKLIKILSLMMKPGMPFQYEPELDALIEFLFWRFSIWVDKPTPGNALMNLRYRDERGVEITRKNGSGLTVTQKLWYYIATVVCQYIWVRLRSFFASQRSGELEQRSLAQCARFCLQHIVGIYKAVSVGNFLIFLYTGKYRSLIERVLRVRLVDGSPDTNICAESGNINSQSDWNDEDIQLMLHPLLDSPLINNLLHSFSNGQNPDSSGKRSLCPICESNPTTSFVALPCQHRYCYYCLQTRCSAAPLFHCVKCSEPVTAIQRYLGTMVVQHKGGHEKS